MGATRIDTHQDYVTCAVCRRIVLLRGRAGETWCPTCRQWLA
jgi:uncharacterized Zn finger protein (UPF0148 family)